MRTLLTVGIPARNAEATIAETISSVLSSSLSDICVVVSDNASTDSTVKIVLELCALDDRISLHEHDVNLGAVENFQFLLSLADTPFFAWVAADDLVESDYLNDCIAALYSRPDAVLSFGNARIEYVHSRRHIATYQGTSAFLTSNPFVRLWRVLTRFRAAQIYGVYRTEHAKAAGPLPSSLSADALFIRRLALVGPFVGHTESAYIYRIPEEWKSAAHYASEVLNDSASNIRRGHYSLERLGLTLREVAGEQQRRDLRALVGALVLASEVRRVTRLYIGISAGNFKRMRMSPRRAIRAYRFVDGLQDVLIENEFEFVSRIVLPYLRWKKGPP